MIETFSYLGNVVWEKLLLENDFNWIFKCWYFKFSVIVYDETLETNCFSKNFYQQILKLHLLSIHFTKL